MQSLVNYLMDTGAYLAILNVKKPQKNILTEILK